MDLKKNVFFRKSVLPFLIPFYHIHDHFVAKFWMAVGFIISYAQIIQLSPVHEIELVGLVLAILPVQLLLGLNILIIIDWLAGTIRAALDPKMKFSLRKWERTAYKMATFNTGGLILGIAMSMFPEPWAIVQYAYYLVVSGNEVFSILRMLGLTATFNSLFALIKQKGSSISMADLWEHIRKQSEEEIHEYDDIYEEMEK